MDQLTYEVHTNRWNSSNNDPLTEVIKATTDPNLADINQGEDDEIVCMISSIQIVDAHWTTTRMGGVSADNDLSSVTSKASNNTITVLDDDPTVNSGKASEGGTTMYTHQSLGGSTLDSDLLMSSNSSLSDTIETNNEDTIMNDNTPLPILAPNGKIPPKTGLPKDDTAPEYATGHKRTKLQIYVSPDTPPQALQELAQINAPTLHQPGYELPYFKRVEDLLDMDMAPPPNLADTFQQVHPMAAAWLNSFTEYLAKSTRQIDPPYPQKLRMIYGLYYLFAYHDPVTRTPEQFGHMLLQLPSFAAAETRIEPLLRTNPNPTSAMLSKWLSFGGGQR